VQRVGKSRKLDVKIEHIANPRIEAEEHYYNAKHSALPSLGLEPHLLTDTVVDSMIGMVQGMHGHIDPSIIAPSIKWRQR
jgi:UDP-sulfoquinovose synthase